MTSAEQSKTKFQGIFIAAPTPMRSDYSLDLEKFRDCIAHLAAAGMQPNEGVYVALGAGGEHMHLSVKERKRTAEAAVEHAAGRIPVFIGVAHTATHTSVELARHAEQIGADGLQVEPPYYFAGTADDIFEYYRAISDAVSLGIAAYNTPWTSGFDMDRKFIERLAGLDNVIGLKWYNGNPFEFVTVLQEFHSRFNIVSNFAGPLTASAFILGARGYVSQGANFAPRTHVAVLRALRRGDYETATKLYMSVEAVYYAGLAQLRKEGYNGEGNFIKACMRVAGVSCGPARPPHREPPAWFAERMLEVLSAAGELSTANVG